MNIILLSSLYVWLSLFFCLLVCVIIACSIVCFIYVWLSLVSLFRLTYPLTARIIGAPQMISQPVSSIFLCSTIAVFPPLLLPTLSSSPFQSALQDGFGQTWWAGDISIPLQFASLYDGQEVFVWSNCLLDNHHHSLSTLCLSLVLSSFYVWLSLVIITCFIVCSVCMIISCFTIFLHVWLSIITCFTIRFVYMSDYHQFHHLCSVWLSLVSPFSLCDCHSFHHLLDRTWLLCGWAGSGLQWLHVQLVCFIAK